MQWSLVFTPQEICTKLNESYFCEHLKHKIEFTVTEYLEDGPLSSTLKYGATYKAVHVCVVL